jgi:hypothetical protein
VLLINVVDHVINFVFLNHLIKSLIIADF